MDMLCIEKIRDQNIVELETLKTTKSQSNRSCVYTYLRKV